MKVNLYQLAKDNNILHQLRTIGCFDILFTGGEPFYRDDIMDIIIKARDY